MTSCSQPITETFATQPLHAFSTYVPRSLVAKLVRTGEIGIAEPREPIVDIAGFTTLSEQMDATAAARLLNLFDRTNCWCPSRPSPHCRSKIENRPQALTPFCRPILDPLRHLGIHCPKNRPASSKARFPEIPIQ
jgi:hypothetical protein